MTKIIKRIAILSAFALTSTAIAETVALWHFDEGVVSNNATTLSSEYNPSIMEATAASNSGGPIPFFSDDIGHSYIKPDPDGANIHANKFSLKFTNTGLPGDLNAQNGGVLTIPHNGIMVMSNLTAEVFVKMDRLVNFPLIIGKARAGSDTTWNIDMDNSGKPRLRIDSYPVGEPSPHPYGFNQSGTSTVSINDGKWHHLAFTYTHSNKLARLYVDYQQRASLTTWSNLVYEVAAMRIGQGAGGRAFDGWIDEVRLSDEVLQPADFMQPFAYPKGTIIMIH